LSGDVVHELVDEDDYVLSGVAFVLEAVHPLHEALKKIHELGIKTYLSVEPCTPEVVKPLAIMSALKDWIDRWIVGPQTILAGMATVMISIVWRYLIY